MGGRRWPKHGLPGDWMMRWEDVKRWGLMRMFRAKQAVKSRTVNAH